MYLLKPLPFLYQDLEPYIDIHTVGVHYLKHQKNYLIKLNEILEKNHFPFKEPMESIYQNIAFFQEKDRNDLLFFLGGVLNHDLYWQSICPKEKEEPKGKLLKAILKRFGSIDEMKKKWIECALSLKGSGYVFLIKTGDEQVEIITTQNQDNPLLFGYLPLFCIDMWEHAYYLLYKNNKQEYLNQFFELANFSYANKKMESDRKRAFL